MTKMTLRFWNLYIFHVFVISCFSVMANSKTVNPERTAKKGIVRGRAWDIMSYSTAILGREDVQKRGGDGSYLRERKADCWPAVKKEVTGCSLGPGREGVAEHGRKARRLDYSKKTC